MITPTPPPAPDTHMADDPPPRLYRVYRPDQAPELIYAHLARVHEESGTLELVSLVGGGVWVTHIYAPQAWTSVSTDAPSRDYVRDLVELTARNAQRADDEHAWLKTATVAAAAKPRPN